MWIRERGGQTLWIRIFFTQKLFARSYVFAYLLLEGTARYAGFTSSSCGGLWPPAEVYKASALWADAFYKSKLEGTARYAGFTSSSCGGLRPPAKAFFALRAKKELFMLFWLTLGHFWCSVVTSVTFSSNLSNFFKKSKK